MPDNLARSAQTSLSTIDADLKAALARAIGASALQASGRGLNVRIRLTCGTTSHDVTISEGVAALGNTADNADIEIAAAPSAWSKVLASPPPPRFNSFTALQIKNDDFEVSGDPLVIAQARAALEDLVENMIGKSTTPPDAPVARDISLIAGRYTPAVINGDACDVYHEQSGQGRPVVMLHTAGADSRQYRHILSDVELARHWRMIAFDMPFHGRTFPPASWTGAPYNLGQTAYADAVIAFLEQVVGEPAILAGCSMGAAITLVVASRRPDLLLGAIALEPPLRSPGRRNPYLADARVATGAHNGAYVRGLMSPASPIEYRKQAEWIYAQGGPGVYSGDLKFYSDEFDGHVIGPQIDAHKTSVQLLCGEYDYSATPEDGKALAALIPGSHVETMPRLGHFPMTENPDLFRTYFMDALKRIP